MQIRLHSFDLETNHPCMIMANNGLYGRFIPILPTGLCFLSKTNL